MRSFMGYTYSLIFCWLGLLHSSVASGWSDFPDILPGFIVERNTTHNIPFNRHIGIGPATLHFPCAFSGVPILLHSSCDVEQFPGIRLPNLVHVCERRLYAVVIPRISYCTPSRPNFSFPFRASEHGGWHLLSASKSMRRRGKGGGHIPTEETCEISWGAFELGYWAHVGWWMVPDRSPHAKSAYYSESEAQVHLLFLQSLWTLV